MNPITEQLIGNNITKQRDEYYKTEDTAKAIIEFLNNNFSDYIVSINRVKNVNDISIQFKYCNYQHSIIWKKDKEDTMMYYFHLGKVVYTIDEMMPDICNKISNILFEKEVYEYNNPKPPIKKSLWKRLKELL